jgi:thiol-disulfide isomerase/thioredoxin
MDTRTRNIALALGAAVIVIALVLAAPGLSAILSPAPAPAAPKEGTVIVYFFYGEECPHCHEVMPVIESLRAKYPEVEFRMLEVWHNEANRATFASIAGEAGSTQTGVPQVIVNKTVLVGSRDIPDQLEQVILTQKKT